MTAPTKTPIPGGSGTDAQNISKQDGHMNDTRVNADSKATSLTTSPRSFRYRADIIERQCSTMTLAEAGAYHRLMRHYCHQQQPLSNDDAVLARIVGVSLRKWKTLRPSLEALFTVTQDVWRLDWMDEEISAQEATHA